jgi:OOP family OmpA-OmpF porin
MKKIAIMVLAITTTQLHADRIESEIGINIGVNSTKNEDGNKFQNPRIGITYQDNKYVVMPRVDLEYVKVKDDYASSLLKGSINAVYEYENNTYTIPYLVGGVGYEYVSSPTDDVFESHPFVQGGAGVRVDLENGMKARVEGKLLKILASSREGNEAILTVGMSFPLSYQKQRKSPPPVVVHAKPAPIIVKPTTKVFYVNNNECSMKIDAPDLDRDGVEDRLDQCPATPCNFTVDSFGCPVKTTLRINFATASDRINENSMFKVNRFADFLLSHKGSLVKIVGHTDSVGTAQSNMSLSRRRASSVMRALIQRGVSASRLDAQGMGESMPISSNNTIEGKAMNRRIEAILSYPKGRK